jgi:hypothetical protein
MTKIGKISASAALLLGLAAPAAFAGPQITFGDEDQGVLQLDYKGQFQLNVRNNGSGSNNDDATTSFDFRRNRISLMGAYGDMLSIYVQTEFSDKTGVGSLRVNDGESDSNFQLLDAVMRFKFNDAFRVNVGKFKYNFSRENLEACEMPLTLDRSLFIRAPFVTTRDMGVAAWGNLFDDKFQYRFDVMEGREAVSGNTTPKSNFRYTGRMHVSLLDAENDYGYKGTYLGKKKVLTVGAAYQYEPDVVYGNTVAKTDKKDYQAWTVDGFFEYPVADLGTFTVSGAYAKYDLDDAYASSTFNDADAIGLNGEKNGWYAKAGYMLPNLPLQFFGRYEKWKFASLSNVVDERVDWYGFGANYYIWGQNLKLTMELSRTNFDKDSEEDFTNFTTQLQVLF